MAVEALRQTAARDAVTREECQRLVSPGNRDANAQQFNQQHTINPSEDRAQGDRVAAKDIELEFNS
jgi:hypothetical protein